jgi:hypothetical protein
LNILFILGRMFQDEHGNIITNDDGEPLIHTDATGLISFNLAMKCPVSVFKGNFLKGYELQVPASPLSLPPSSSLVDHSINVYQFATHSSCPLSMKTCCVLVIFVFLSFVGAPPPPPFF